MRIIYGGKKLGIRQEDDYIYFVDDNGDVSRTKDYEEFKMVAKCGMKKQKGFMYFIDQHGDIVSIREGEINKFPEFEKEYKILEIWRRKRIEDEERARLKEKKLRNEVRRKLLEEEFKDLKKEGRNPIPEEVRHEVWRRDNGMCAKCGSRENLEFDHIIPISKGGSSTVRNIELLCEKCNREKHDNIV